MNPVIRPTIAAVTTIAALFLSHSPTARAQDVFDLDNTHSSIIFSISHLNISYTYGRFNRCSGVISINNDNPASSKFRFTIDANSIDTASPDRDNHLKSEDFLNVEQFPTIEFVSQRVDVDKQNYTVTGKMKLHGQEREVTIPLQLLGVGKGMQGEIRMGMIGKFTIKRSEFGMDKMMQAVGDDVAITFSFEAIRQE